MKLKRRFKDNTNNDNKDNIDTSINYNDTLNNHIKESYNRNKKLILNILFINVMFLFILSVYGSFVALNSFLTKSESKLRIFYDDGIKYIEVIKGYIKEELVVETGNVLPSIDEYFSEEYDLINDVAIQYFKNKNFIHLDEFTYELDGVYYLKGLGTIDVVIFDDSEYESKLVIADTTIPEVLLQNVSIYQNEELDMKKFVAIYVDNSQINDFTVRFKNGNTYSDIGNYDVELLVCDTSNNCYEGKTKLEIKEYENNEKDNNENLVDNNNNNNSNNTSNKNNTGNNNSNNNSNNKENDNSNNKNDDIINNSSYNKTCKLETIEKENYNYVEDYYGTLVTTFYKEIVYKIKEDCTKEIIKYSGQGNTVINFSAFNGTLKDMLDEAKNFYENDYAFQKSRNNILNATNQARKENNLNELSIDTTLNMIATLRAMEIAYSDVFSHTRPNGSSCFTLWKEYNENISLNLASENLSYGYGSDAEAFEHWMLSYGHRENILREGITKTGIGKFTFYDKTYRVQLFSA